MTSGYEENIDYDKELEKSVLGIFLIEPYSYSRVHGLLSEDCFYLPSHNRVYQTIRNMWTLGMQIDLVSVCRRMYDKGHVVMEDFSNTGYYLTTICADVVQSAHLQQWCLMLRELAVKREVIRITREGLAGDDPLAATQRIQKQLEDALKVSSTNDWIDASMAAVQLTEHMDEVRGKVIGLQTGFDMIDNVNGGLRGGQLIVLGARPAVGKSALMGGLAVHIAKQSAPVGIISLEMPARDIFGRMASSESGISFREIDRNELNEPQMNVVMKSITNLASLPIYFSDTAKTNIFDIRAKAELLKQKHGIKALFVDYLQLVEETTGKNRNRENAISEISRGLKMIAMNMDIPVIALSQLNRESESKDRKPKKSDLRESGSLEQDADIVMLLHRDYAIGKVTDEQGNSTINKAELLIEKWRNGSPLKVDLHFEPTTMKFSNPKSAFEQFQSLPNPYAGMRPMTTDYKSRAAGEKGPF